MNILGNNSDKLNDIIFENRNKTYGAYVIRSSYNDSLKKSLLYLMSIVSLLFGSVIINNKMNANSVIESTPFLEDPTLEAKTYVTEVDVTPPVAEPIQNLSAPATAPSGAMPTQIVDVLTNTTVINTENPISGVGTETATGISSIGTETSTLTSIHVQSSAPIPATSEILVTADEMPEFEGGYEGLMRYVGQNVVYPSLAREIGIEGKVHISFVINEFGNVENINVMRGIGYGCDEEVVRVLKKMPKWKKVGKNAGHPVKVRFNIPVAFKLK
ncbi:MAG: energy transducer TonB [Bacteroidia bacterium]|nr:energy transducer TonB [Bacteroidia bacterium]